MDGPICIVNEMYKAVSQNFSIWELQVLSLSILPAYCGYFHRYL